jgi:hypothetical protein
VEPKDDSIAHPLGAANVPPLPEPWREASETGAPLRGCGKPLALGCGCLAMALVATLMLVGARAPQLVAWSVGLWQTQVEAGLPEDVTPQERARLDAAFDSFPGAIASGGLTMDGLFEVFGEINEAIASAQRGELSRAGVMRLIEALERAIARTEPAGDGVQAWLESAGALAARGETRVRLRAGICGRWQGVADERDAVPSCRRPNAVGVSKPPRPKGGCKQAAPGSLPAPTSPLRGSGRGRRGAVCGVALAQRWTQHRHRSRALHPAPRRSQRSPRGFHHGLLA